MDLMAKFLQYSLLKPARCTVARCRQRWQGEDFVSIIHRGADEFGKYHSERLVGVTYFASTLVPVRPCWTSCDAEMVFRFCLLT
jgi:hypothetical protein